MARTVASCLTFVGFSIFSVSSQSCHDAYECTSSTLSITEPNATNLECFGYSSCSDSTLLESVTDATIQCLGSYACHGSDIVQHTHTTPSTFGDIICCGLSSCSSISSLYNKNGSIACDGELSCKDSNINIIDDKLFCLGDRACLDAKINVTNSKVYVSGHRAAQNATFTTLGVSSVLYDFDGVYAGDGAEVICNTNQTCRLYCHSTGCNGLKLTCLNEPCDWDITCSYADKSDVCPDNSQWKDIINVNDRLTLPILNENVGSSIPEMQSSTMRICEGNDNCNGYLECSGNEFNQMENNEGNDVCCSAMQSCNGENDEVELSLNDGKDLRCDGTMSCASMMNYSKITINDNDNDDDGSTTGAEQRTIRNINSNIYLTSYAAATGTEIILNGNDKDVYCTGMESCYGSIIRNANNIYCNGGWSCKEAQLIENVSGDLYAYGVSGIAKSTVNNVDGNVYCGTQYSCSSAKIIGVKGDVLGLGYSVMASAQFTNIDGAVAAFGTKGLKGAKATNVSEVYCEGNLGCNEMVLRNIGTLYATGVATFRESILISERGESDGIMTASFDLSGTNDDVYIYCNKSDTCNINCVSSTSCKDFTIYCEGICNIDCEDGFECPEIKTQTTYVPVVTDSNDNNNDNEVVSESTSSSQEDDDNNEVTSIPIVNQDITSTGVNIIIDPITGEGESGSNGGQNEDSKDGNGHDCGKGGYGGGYGWFMIVIVCIIVIIIGGGCCFTQYCSDGNNNNNGDDKQMEVIQRVTSTSVIVNDNGITSTTKVNGDGEENENSKSSEDSLSGSSSDKKLTEKYNGEV